MKGGSTEQIWIEDVSGAKAAARARFGGEGRNDSYLSLQMHYLPQIKIGIFSG